MTLLLVGKRVEKSRIGREKQSSNILHADIDQKNKTRLCYKGSSKSRMHFLTFDLDSYNVNTSLIFKRCPGHWACPVSGARIRRNWEAQEEARRLGKEFAVDIEKRYRLKRCSSEHKGDLVRVKSKVRRMKYTQLFKTREKKAWAVGSHNNILISLIIKKSVRLWEGYCLCPLSAWLANFIIYLWLHFLTWEIWIMLLDSQG